MKRIPASVHTAAWWIRVLVGGTLAAVATLAFAQPQAPIEWGPIRLLQNAQGQTIAHGVYARGDTIVLRGGQYVDNEHQYAMVSLSGDNGLSWSPWHTFSFDGVSWDDYASVAYTSQGIFICVNTAVGRGFYRTMDLGQSWSPPIACLPGLMITDALGDTVIATAVISSGVFGVTWTSDGGWTFAPRREIDMGSSRVSHDCAASDSFLHIMTLSRRRPQWGSEVCHSRGLWDGGPFTTPFSLTPNFPSTYTADIEFDRHGTGVVASVVSYDGLTYHPGAVVVHVTQDDGESWTGPDTLLSTETASQDKIYVRHCGPLWAVVWSDSTHVSPFVRGGGWYCFSANHGRSWYPRQQAFGDSIFSGGLDGIDLRPDFLRIHAFMGRWNGVAGSYFFQWEGTIHPDTITPMIESVVQLPDFLPADTTVFFSASATDNDSLWLMQVVLKHPLHSDSLVVPLQRQEENDYFASWTIPFDTSTFLYYYRAEDMWEHVAVWPDSGVYSFHLIRDTIPPVLTSAAQLPELMPPDTNVEFSVQAFDNDSLISVLVVLFPPQADSLMVMLSRSAGDHFHAIWRVPADTGLWYYYYRAQDRWANVADYPDSPWSFRVDITDAVDPFIAHPSSFLVSVSPNPFNSSATFTFTLPRTTPVTLSVFNILGRRVREVNLGPMAAGEHWYVFEAGGLPSGVYLARVEAAGRAETRKIVLMR